MPYVEYLTLPGWDDKPEKPPLDLDALLKQAEGNKVVYQAFVRTHEVLSNHSFICCSVSGGSDSDVMLDMIWRLDDKSRVRYVWFDTGMEYQATKDHLAELEAKYQIKIERIRPVKTVAACCKEYGQPFGSKLQSQLIEAAQIAEFPFTDSTLEDDLQKYSRQIARWWNNAYIFTDYNVSKRKYLREFLIENPPGFRVSAKCCDYAKKGTAHKFYRGANIDLSCIGVRSAEGGVRQFAGTCYTGSDGSEPNLYRPIYWFKNSDKDWYCETFGVTHSRCYTEYGLKRTGCVGCPFGRHVLEELEQIKKFEPRAYAAAHAVFKESYEYTRKYKEYRAQRDRELKDGRKETADREGTDRIECDQGGDDDF